MTFLNILLLGGTAGATIPFIIYLFHKSRYVRVRWGAMHLLDAVVKQNKRRIRLDQILLLLLRASIPVILALCMARPVITGMKSLIRNAKTSMVILLDNSFSMEAGDTLRTNFAHATDETAMILDNLPLGSEVAVVGMAGAMPAIQEPSYDAARVGKELVLSEGGYGKVSAPSSIEAAAGVFSRMNHADREMVIVSDFQKMSWSEEGGPARARAMEIVESQPVKPRAVLFRVGKEVTDNVSVESVELSKTLVGIEQKIKVRANLRNFGEGNYPDLRVYFRVDGKERAVSQASLGPGQTSQVLFSHRFEIPGSHVIEVQADADVLKTDNGRMASVPVLDELPVLIVSGDVSKEPLASETAFLEIALRPFSTAKSGLQDLIVTRVVEESKVDPKEFFDVKVVILANVEKLADNVLKALEEFVREGGGLLVFPGDRVAGKWYRENLVAGGQGLLPYDMTSLAGSVKEDIKPSTIVVQHFEHKALAPFNDPKSGSLRGAEIRLWYRLGNPDPGADGPGARVLVHMDSGDPFLVEKDFGNGRVIQSCVPCDADWSNLPMRPFYLPLMQQVVTHLASKVYPPRNVEIGDKLAAFLPVELADKTGVMTTPSGEKHELRVVRKGMRGMVEFERTERPGLYLFETPSEDTIHFVVNTSKEESDLAQLAESEVEKLAEEMGASLVGSWKEYSALDRSRRFGQEVWVLLLWLCLILIFGELLLVRYIRKRSVL